MIDSRVLTEIGERIAEDGPAAHHGFLQHLATLVDDSAPGTAAALADRSAPDVVRQRALAVASAVLLRLPAAARASSGLAA